RILRSYPGTTLAKAASAAANAVSRRIASSKRKRRSASTATGLMSLGVISQITAARTGTESASHSSVLAQGVGRRRTGAAELASSAISALVSITSAPSPKFVIHLRPSDTNFGDKGALATQWF